MKQEITKKRRKIYSFLNKQKFFIFSLIFLCIFLILASFAFYRYYSKRIIFISPLAIENPQKILTSDDNPIKKLEELLIKNKIAFSSISSTEDDSILIKLNSGEEIYFSTKKSLNPQVSSLQLILSRLTIEGKRFTHLDFRYDNPIIAFN